jgi:hypothetical protein
MLDKKYDLQSEDLIAYSKRAGSCEATEDLDHHLFSKIVFETRKAVEYKLAKEDQTRNGDTS